MQNEERINGLETQVRTLKRIVYGFGCLLVAGIVVSATSVQTVPDVIQAKKFEVVNDEGKVIVELSNLKGGGVDNGKLVTRTSEGQTLVKLSAGSGGGTVRTENGEGQTLVRLSSSPDGEGTITTENGKGQTLVTLSSSPDGEGVVITQNGKGQNLVKLEVYEGGGIIMTINDKGEITSIIPTILPTPKTSD